MKGGYRHGGKTFPNIKFMVRLPKVKVREKHDENSCPPKIHSETTH